MSRTVVRNRGFEIPRYTHIVLSLIIVVVVTACSAGPIKTNPDPPLPQPSTVAVPVDGCPAIAANEPGAPASVMVDYVDFVVVGRTTYLAGPGPVPRVDKTQLDKIVMASRCSFSELNNRTGEMTPMPGDGDTGFLPPGTPVYTMRGWSPACRLVAEHDGALHVYLAQQDGGTEARPIACAVS